MDWDPHSPKIEFLNPLKDTSIIIVVEMRFKIVLKLKKVYSRTGNHKQEAHWRAAEQKYGEGAKEVESEGKIK